MQDVGVAVLFMDAGPSELQDFAAHRFERAEIKEFFAVVAQIPFSTIPALHAVRSGELPGGRVMHHQVVADEIEPVAVQPRPGRAVQPFTKFAIENQIAQPLACDDIWQRFSHPHAEQIGGGEWILAVVHQDGGLWHE